MTRILVTGAAGYIGSVLVPYLLANEYEVIALDNFMYKQTTLLDHCYNKRLDIVRGDVRDLKVLAKCVDKVDVIIPLAAIVGAPACSTFPREAESTNLQAIITLLNLRRERPIIFPTTNSGYGIGESGKFCTEETPLRPISLYGALKKEAEHFLIGRKNAISLRLATVFGASPRMRLDLLVNDFVYRALTDHYVVLYDADAKRNFIHIRDVAKAFVHCIENFNLMKNQVYNVGLSSANLSKKELCLLIQKQIPGFFFTEAPIGNDPDKRDYIVSNEKIEGTGFMPETSLEQGITELIKSYQIIRAGSFQNA